MLWDDQFLSRRDVVWVEAQSVRVGGDERLRADVKLARNTIHRIAGLHHVFAGAGDWRGRANRLAAAGDDGRSQIGVRRQRGVGRGRRVQAATPHPVYGPLLTFHWSAPSSWSTVATLRTKVRLVRPNSGMACTVTCTWSSGRIARAGPSILPSTVSCNPSNSFAASPSLIGTCEVHLESSA